MLQTVALILALAAAAEGSTDEVRKKLDAPVAIQGYPCAGGYAWFFGDGALRSCAVSRETQFGEAAVPKGSRIHVNRAGKPDFVFLSQDTKVRNLTCRGGGHSYMTAFYGSGKLRLCWLAADQDVDGVPCMRASFWSDVFGGGVGTYFHENGRLSKCKLNRGFTIDGRSFERGDHIALDANGRSGM